MENASKALLMAAGMLITVLVASMFALLFSTMSDYAKEYENRNIAQDIQKFNAQFEQYMKNGEATAQDIVSVYNLAEYYRKEGIEVKIFIASNELNNSNTPFPTGKTSEEFIKDNIEIDQITDATGKKLYQINNYKVNNITYDNGRISEIKFESAGKRTLYEK